jgi:hypothetical protein
MYYPLAAVGTKAYGALGCTFCGGKRKAIKSWNRPTIEEAAASAGASCEASYLFRLKDIFADHCFLDVSPRDARSSFAIVDRRIVTAVKPASAHATAEEAVKAHENL